MMKGMSGIKLGFIIGVIPILLSGETQGRAPSRLKSHRR